MAASEHPITRLLNSGSPASAEELLPLVYDELRRLAQARLARENAGHTLQATALVHEAFLRVAGGEGDGFGGRRHFFAAAAEAMRRILIDQARNKRRLRRGGDAQKVSFDEAFVAIEPPDPDVLAVHEALEELEREDPGARELVNLRYFTGLTTRETAAVLGVSESTVEREWRFVRTYLQGVLRSGDEA